MRLELERRQQDKMVAKEREEEERLELEGGDSKKREER